MGERLSVEYSRKFLKQAARLPQRIIEQAELREDLFRDSPFDPRLETHKLHGEEKDVWSFSINRSYRIKFIFLGKNKVLFLEVGTHNIYK